MFLEEAVREARDVLQLPNRDAGIGRIDDHCVALTTYHVQALGLDPQALRSQYHGSTGGHITACAM